MEQYTELEQMRNQLATLKEKLANQEIVNDKLLRKTISTKLSGIHRYRNMIFIFGAVALFMVISISLSYNLSYWFMGYSVLFLIFLVYKTFAIHAKIESQDIYSIDLLTTVKELKLMKKKYIRSHWYSIPLVIVYLVWLFYEATNVFDAEVLKYFIAGGATGAVIGITLGLSLQRKFLRMCDDIIRDIES